jgi:hypothetical protein
MKFDVVNGIAFVLGILIIILAFFADSSLRLTLILIGLVFILAGAWMARRAARRG